MSSKDLAQIVSLAKKGQEEAMAELIHEIEKPLFRYLFHLCGNEALAQDLCQESLVKILTKIDQIKDDSGVMSWVYQVGRNQFIDETRKNKTRNSLSNNLPEESEAGESVPEEVLTIRAVLEQLDVSEKEVLILVDMEGYSYLEVAKILNISEAAVRSRLHRARSAFLTDYDEYKKAS